MSEAIKASVRQWTFIMNAAYANNWPEKLGERTFTTAVRASLIKNTKKLFKLLRDLSPIWKDDRYTDAVHFGPRDAWKRKELSADAKAKLEPGVDIKATYECVDPHRIVPVEVDEKVKQVISWLMVGWSHPESKACQGAGWQVENCDPIVEQLGIEDWLDKEIGFKDDPANVEFKPKVAETVTA